MKGETLQSTLRELRFFFLSPRFWLTIALVALVFTVAGPFGTRESMPVLSRAAFWLTLHATAFSLAATVIVVSDRPLRLILPARPARMMAGAIMAALPIGAAVEALQAGFTGQAITADGMLEQIMLSLVLSPLLCLLTYLTMGDPTQRARLPDLRPRHPPLTPAAPSAPDTTAADAAHVLDPAPATAPARTTAPDKPALPRILARLRPENRGALLQLSVQDHYTEVLTSRGRELLLLRFADALEETGETPGLRIHRSHWIADAHVKGLQRIAGRLVVLSQRDEVLPVSRPYEAEARARFSSGPTRPIMEQPSTPETGP